MHSQARLSKAPSRPEKTPSRVAGLMRAGAAYALPLVPLAVMIWPLWRQLPGVTEAAGDILGFGAVLSLLACLAVTPVTLVTGSKGAARWRRHFGVCVFILGFAGLVIALTGRSMSPDAIGMRSAGHSREWTGTIIVALLIPLAATSSLAAQKALGAHWKTWQRRLTWAVWAAVTVHLLVLGRPDVITAWLLASGPLAIARIPAVRADLTRWRRSGFTDTHLWILTGMAGLVFATGTAVLLGLEANAVVTLYRGS
jgi:DMSO/TMAO reductase YedYZ heme-binding membrane subunit